MRSLTKMQFRESAGFFEDYIYSTINYRWHTKHFSPDYDDARSHKANFFSVGKVYRVAMETCQRLAIYVSDCTKQAILQREIHLFLYFHEKNLSSLYQYAFFRAFFWASRALINAKAPFSFSQTRVIFSHHRCRFKHSHACVYPISFNPLQWLYTVKLFKSCVSRAQTCLVPLFEI